MTTETIQSKTIQVNGVPVTCHSDGSITCYNIASGEPVRSFGSVNGNGYLLRKVNGSQYRVHRLIASAFHGKIKKAYQVDHIDGNRLDNRIENLRIVNRSQNLRGARKTHGRCKYRGVDCYRGRWRARVLSGYVGSFDTELEAAEAFDDAAFHEHDFPLEGLNFPQRMLDKMAKNDTPMSMTISSENAERSQESRILSYRIDRMMEQRKALSEEKRKLKDELATYSVK
jgi:hypothetical protein